MNEDAPSHWADDVLDRWKIAEFLSTSLPAEARAFGESRGTGLTVALDADWGTGKTYFIHRWAQDLRAKGHPVAIFDAWQNDVGDEAAIALMSRINQEIDTWTERLPPAAQAKKTVVDQGTRAVHTLRRAIIPTSKVVGAALLKRYTGIAVNDLLQASDIDGDAMDVADHALNAGLDDLFSRTLQEHEERTDAVAEFKRSVTKLLRTLEEHANARMPAFVFVDELDRCRPTYAIRLLEEVKHLFGAENMCFVVSTNLVQLSESVCAVYGDRFDSSRYLKRFFDRQYTLPDPPDAAYIEKLWGQSPLATGRRMSIGLPLHDTEATAQKALGAVSSSFALDLRSQDQVFAIFTSAAAAVPASQRLYILWLFFLCCVRFRSPSTADSLMAARIDQKRFFEVCAPLLRKNSEIPYFAPSEDPFQRAPATRRHSTVLDVCWRYYDWSFQNLVKLRDKPPNRYDYPSSNLEDILTEAPNPFSPSQVYLPSFSSYMELVKYAGMVSASDAQ